MERSFSFDGLFDLVARLSGGIFNNVSEVRSTRLLRIHLIRYPAVWIVNFVINLIIFTFNSSDSKTVDDHE